MLFLEFSISPSGSYGQYNANETFKNAEIVEKSFEISNLYQMTGNWITLGHLTGDYVTWKNSEIIEFFAFCFFFVCIYIFFSESNRGASFFNLA